jgi:hypothetical protein
MRPGGDVALDAERGVPRDRVAGACVVPDAVYESFWRFWLTFHIHLPASRREFGLDIGPGALDLETR